MDYEKKYNEALERARKVHRNYKNLFPAYSYSEDIESIFPELRESEDEMMIREFNDWLCEEIEWRTNDVRDEKDRRTLNMLRYVLTKVKDWLEKQKETLHISESCKENADSFTSEDERINKAIFKALSKKDARDVLLAEGVQVSEALTYLEKQKEQKPNFSEKDSTDFEIEVHEIIAQARNDSRLNDADVLKQFEEEAAFALMLKANKLIEQKPAEWSEEDKTRLTNILIMLQEYVIHHYSKDDVNKSVDWLKALPERFNLQPKQEWSEEDERMRNGLISLIEEIKLRPLKRMEDWDGYTHFLKSLRPQPEVEWSKDDKDYYDTIVRKLEVIGDDSGLSNNQIKFLREHCPSHRSEWNEEDKNMWTHLNGYLNGFSCSEYAIKQMADWFYELPNRFNLQPKQEWTEEDKENIESIKIILREAFSKGISCEEEVLDLTDWLNNLHLQPKQEWSKEDEKMVKFYEDDYDNNLGNMPMCDVIENRIKFKGWLLNKLKSLRPQPHWKPSEGQEEPEYYQHFDPDC